MARGNQFVPFVNPITGVRVAQPCALNAKETWAYGMDKVLHGVVQLISLEVYQQTIKGAVAELGVFRGFTASVLNQFFPDRKLYLFDTFKGFDQRDLNVEEQLGYNTINYEKFNDTNIELVMKKMAHKNNVVIKKGWFPDSVVGVEDETFCFVLIDADLYQPIYEGLHWFYPRLAKGGFILVDDYHWSDYAGAKKAVQDFSNECGISYVPIPNATGSVVFAKSKI